VLQPQLQALLQQQGQYGPGAVDTSCKAHGWGSDSATGSSPGAKQRAFDAEPAASQPATFSPRAVQPGTSQAAPPPPASQHQPHRAAHHPHHPARLQQPCSHLPANPATVSHLPMHQHQRPSRSRRAPLHTWPRAARHRMQHSRVASSAAAAAHETGSGGGGRGGAAAQVRLPSIQATLHGQDVSAAGSCWQRWQPWRRLTRGRAGRNQTTCTRTERLQRSLRARSAAAAAAAAAKGDVVSGSYSWNLLLASGPAAKACRGWTQGFCCTRHLLAICLLRPLTTVFVHQYVMYLLSWDWHRGCSGCSAVELVPQGCDDPWQDLLGLHAGGAATGQQPCCRLLCDACEQGYHMQRLAMHRRSKPTPAVVLPWLSSYHELQVHVEGIEGWDRQVQTDC
jgi:hypothetical protein